MNRILNVLKDYAGNLANFQRNAWLYLIHTILSGAAMGVFRLLFNFYGTSLGYDSQLIGGLITASSFTALIVALPMGLLADKLGRKVSLLTSSLTVAGAVMLMAMFPSPGLFIGMNILMGMAQSLGGITMGPFLIENSSDRERVYLFSFASGMNMISGFAGNWIGGNMPGWLAVGLGVTATSAPAYAAAIKIIAIGAVVAALPLMLLRTPRLSAAERSLFAPFSYLGKHFSQMGKLILPMLLVSIGAGLTMPFMNLFFRDVHLLSDAAVGSTFAWGSLAMGLGLIIAPPLADRMGKIKLVVLTQGLSIPFLALLGFGPLAVSLTAYYIRLTLMNMSGPVYQTFVMEKVEPSARGTIASLVSMANSFGWAFSPIVSGWIQVRYGFGPAFWGTIILYAAAVFFYWWFFMAPRNQPQSAQLSEAPRI